MRKLQFSKKKKEEIQAQIGKKYSEEVIPENEARSAWHPGQEAEWIIHQ